jgi:hypothetical protein
MKYLTPTLLGIGGTTIAEVAKDGNDTYTERASNASHTNDTNTEHASNASASATKGTSADHASDANHTNDTNTEHASNARATNNTNADHSSNASENDTNDTNDIKDVPQETIITVLKKKLEMDPELSAGFKKCLSSKNKKLSDYDTLQVYRFAVQFNNKWFERHVTVNVRVIFVNDIHLTSIQGKEVLVRKNDILNIIDHVRSWFSQAEKVIQLFEKLSNQGKELE